MSKRYVRNDFVGILSRVSPGLSSKDFIEQASSFVFWNGWLVTFNDEITCRTKTGMPADLTCVVPAKKLMDALNSMSSDDIDVSATDEGLYVVGINGREDFLVRGEREVVLPIDQVEYPGKQDWTAIDPESYQEAVKHTTDAAGTNAEEFLTTCVHVTPTFMEATDRRQMVRYEIDTGVAQSLLVKASSLAHAVHVNPTHVSLTANWLHLFNESVSFACRVHSDQYPTDTIERVMQFRGDPLEFPQGVDLGARLGGVFSSDDREDDKVVITLAPGLLTVRGDGGRGWGRRRIPLNNYAGPEINFRIAPAMLERVMEKNKDCEIGDGRLRIAGESWTYLTVLGRVETPPPAAAKPTRPRAKQPAAAE